MRTISQIIGGAQLLLPLEYEAQNCFPELLTDMRRSFIHHPRVAEEPLPLFCFGRHQKTGRPHPSASGRAEVFPRVSGQSVFPLNRDSTAIETRECPVNKKEEEEEKKAVKRGRAGDERRKGA